MARKLLALFWAACVAACALGVWLALPKTSVESSVFALLPRGQGNPAAQAAGEALSAELEKRFIVLAVHADAGEAAKAAEAYAERIRPAPGILNVTCKLPQGGASFLLDFYAPHRFALLSDEDREALKADPAWLAEAAQRVLYLPPGVSGSLGFKQDPFGTFGRWLAGRGAAGSGLSPQNGYLTAAIDGKTAVAVLGTLGKRGRGIEAQRDLAAHFDAAGRAASIAVPGAALMRSGFVFHELLAAQSAHKEMLSIGTVSAVLMLALMLFAFRGLMPALLGFLPVAVGCLVGTGALLLASGGKVHLIVMVFGATIVGVAEDYGMLFIAGLYGDGPWNAAGHLRAVTRTLFLGLLTTVLGYAALFFVPIPGVRQIGIFSIVGLAAAWTTVMLWYPWLGARLKLVGPGARRGAEEMERKWPKLGVNPWTRVVLAALALAAAFGISRLRVDDDVRLLYARNRRLADEQEKVAAALHMPGSGRFLLVRAADEQSALFVEENLIGMLAQADPEAGPAMGVTRFVPSQSRQSQDRDFLIRTLGEGGTGARLEQELETPGLARSLLRDIEGASRPLTVAEWLDSPVSLPFRHLWRGPPHGQGFATVVLPPAGLSLTSTQIDSIARRVSPGITLVDQVQEVSDTLGLLRRHLVWVLLAGFLVIAVVMSYTFRASAWRTLAPAVLGSAAGLGALGWAGLPLNLFSLLALALILGMGIDYGIFVQEGRRRRAAALVAINVGAASTILAFGMLVLSATPALKGFGLVLAAGLGAAWLTAPCFATISEEGNGHGA